MIKLPTNPASMHLVWEIWERPLSQRRQWGSSDHHRRPWVVAFSNQPIQINLFLVNTFLRVTPNPRHIALDFHLWQFWGAQNPLFFLSQSP
jgi:hypothetical protein